jgi:hypothetical protein
MLVDKVALDRCPAVDGMCVDEETSKQQAGDMFKQKENGWKTRQDFIDTLLSFAISTGFRSTLDINNRNF